MKKIFKILSTIAISIAFITGIANSATILFPYQGGTGTGTAPTSGQVLVGTSDGKYAPATTGNVSAGSSKIIIGGSPTGAILGTGVTVDLGTVALDDLSDVSLGTTSAGEVIKYNGVSWTNAPESVGGASTGVILFLDDTVVVDAYRGLLIEPDTVTATQTDSAAVTSATSPVLIEGYVWDTVLNRTAIPGGIWEFDMYDFASSTSGNSFLGIDMFKVVSGSGTVTVTGVGTSRTATVTGGTPFVSGDANAALRTGSYLQTSGGTFKITAFTSDSVVTISTAIGYVNESGVSYTVHNKIFGLDSPEINHTSVELQSFFSAQSSFATNTTDKLAMRTYAVTDNGTPITVSFQHNGTTAYSHFHTTLSNLHNDLGGLQGGTSGEYYHLTSTEYTGTGTGNFVRIISPSLTTPNIGVATATSINKVLVTAPATSATLTIADGKTLTANNTLTFTGTDTSSVAFGSGGTVLYNGGALGTPSSGTVTNLTGTASININGTVGATTPTTGKFTTVETTGNIELGHATDTTISRVSAGVAAVEGVRVITSAGTTSGTILKNNGTTFVASTETYAAPGTSGNVMTSDGTNWTSAAPSGGSTWGKLGETTLSADAETITVSSLPARKNLKIVAFLNSSSGDLYPQLRFNGDTGSRYNYAFYRPASTSSFTTGTDASSIQLYASYLSTTSVMSMDFSIANRATSIKTMTGLIMLSPTGFGAPENAQGTATWKNTTDSISSITLFNSFTQSFKAGSWLTIYGSDN